MASLMATSTSMASKSLRVSTFTKSAIAPVHAQAARSTIKVFAAERQVWYPGNPAPAHLDNTLAGDYGFDPLGFSADPERKKWMVQAELVHGRTAMLAVAGVLFTAIGAQAGAGFPQWYDAGKVVIQNSPIPFGTLLFTQLLLTGWVETKRLYDLRNPSSQADGSFLGVKDGFKGKENGYPGGVFDFMGLSKGDEKKYKEYKVKEVKNGRLAMLAFLGFIAQYAATGKGPIQNLSDHLADPYHTTFATNGVSLPFL